MDGNQIIISANNNIVIKIILGTLGPQAKNITGTK